MHGSVPYPMVPRPWAIRVVGSSRGSWLTPGVTYSFSSGAVFVVGPGQQRGQRAHATSPPLMGKDYDSHQCPSESVADPM